MKVGDVLMEDWQLDLEGWLLLIVSWMTLVVVLECIEVEVLLS